MNGRYYRFTVRGAHFINDKQGWIKSLRFTFFKGKVGSYESAELELNRMIKNGRLKEVVFNSKVQEWEDLEINQC